MKNEFKIGDRVKSKEFKGYVVGTKEKYGQLRVIITHNPNNYWTDTFEWANGEPCWLGDYCWELAEINWQDELE